MNDQKCCAGDLRVAKPRPATRFAEKDAWRTLADRCLEMASTDTLKLPASVASAVAEVGGAREPS